MYHSLAHCIDDLEKNGHLVRIKEEIDPYLEMAALHLKVHEAGGPALFFENIKGSKYPAVSNLFGTMERSKFIFRNTWKKTEQLIAIRNNPMAAIKKPWKHFDTFLAATKALPRKTKFPAADFNEINISDLPQIHHWQMDGGAFITLPQVYTEDIDKPGIMHANLGMYRIQLSGNDYVLNKEIGLHYQIHRGIGVHQTKANKLGKPLKVSIFIGGHPAHTLAAVMPLPEGLSELTFGGLLAGRRFRYSYHEGYCISNDADFVITGEVYPNENKPEGPFGDHLGYYSLVHPFPLMRVHKVYARKNAIWNFTVVGRPPQEDTAFGNLIHELTGTAIQEEIKGVQAVHAVDAAGVHPLLFAIGSERYTPYLTEKKPAELLTQANSILGFGQLSLAKYLFITAENDGIKLNTRDEAHFLQYILERIQLERDIHFQTNTTIDTLDYSGNGLNTGSKVIFAAYGNKIRTLSGKIPDVFATINSIKNAHLILPGIVAIEFQTFTSYENAQQEIEVLTNAIKTQCTKEEIDALPMFVICDDSKFTALNLKNFLWVTFTRSNPSHDIYGIDSKTEFKHWGCRSLLIDARKKPFHAPELTVNETVENNIKRFFVKGASLYAKIN